MLNKTIHLFVFLAVFVSSSSFAAQPPATLALLPFQLHAAKDLSYLGSGIQSMLASRLTANAGVRIVKQSAGADYVLNGSLTSLGGALSIDAVLTAAKGGAPQNFYATAPKEDAIIRAINLMSWDIAVKSFGKKRPANTTSIQQQVASIPAASAPAPAYRTANPERAFRSSYQGGYGMGNLAQPVGVANTPFGFTKSQNFRMGLTAMDVGDVDGDGQAEYVLAAKHELRIYRGHGSRFEKIAQLSTSERYAIHAVTLADLNNNGRMEIYVSAADAKRPNSFVLEWDGKQFAKLADNQKFYIRVIDIPGEGPVLAGQKDGFGNLLSPGIFRLSLKNGNLVKGAKVPVNGVNLFDFSIADLDGNGTNEVIAISHGNKILVLRPNGTVKWVSDDYYGGTTKYLGGIGFDDIDKDVENGSFDPERIYVPARILIRDVNGDGQPDVIINKNLSSASRLLARHKSFPSGEIHALTWNGIGLTELWHTRKIDGYIADYNLGPIHKVKVDDGKGGKGTVNGAELYVGLVLRSGGLNILKNSDSTILTFPLQLPESKPLK